MTTLLTMASSNSTLTQARLKELLHYDPETGLFTRLTRAASRTKIGAIAGTTTKYGYCLIRADNDAYNAHRLAWLYMTGSWPTDQIDHINCVRHDNRFANLREANGNVNLQNQRKPHSNNALRILGVYYKKARKKYVASLMIAGKQTTLGYYKTPDEASAAYLLAKRKHHPGCTL